MPLTRPRRASRRGEGASASDSRRVTPAAWSLYLWRQLRTGNWAKVLSSDLDEASGAVAHRDARHAVPLLVRTIERPEIHAVFSERPRHDSRRGRAPAARLFTNKDDLDPPDDGGFFRGTPIRPPETSNAGKSRPRDLDTDRAVSRPRN